MVVLWPGGGWAGGPVPGIHDEPRRGERRRVPSCTGRQVASRMGRTCYRDLSDPLSGTIGVSRDRRRCAAAARAWPRRRRNDCTSERAAGGRRCSKRSSCSSSAGGPAAPARRGPGPARSAGRGQCLELRLHGLLARVRQLDLAPGRPWPPRSRAGAMSLIESLAELAQLLRPLGPGVQLALRLVSSSTCGLSRRQLASSSH